MPFFSIILPTYNRAHFLPIAIESVLKQTFHDWELIIIDDGSTDNTLHILQEYLKDQRLQYIFQHNQERSIARNNGILAANGQYICFLDSDDYYLPNHLTTFYEVIEKENGFAYFTSCYTELDAQQMPVSVIDEGTMTDVEFVFVNTITSQAVCLHRSLLLENKYNPKIRIGEDRELWVRMSKKTPFIHIRSHTFVLREHSNRSINATNQWACREGLATMKQICSDNKKHISKSLRNQFLAIEYYNSAKYYIANNQKLKSLQFLFIVLLYNPNRFKEVAFWIKQLFIKHPSV